MPVAVPGLVALRRHLFGRQVVFGTAVAATKAYGFSGTPDVNLNWTDPEGDFGSIDPITPPTRGAPDLTASLTDNSVAYNSLPIMLSSVLGDDESPSGGGTAKTWGFTPASLTADEIDLYSYQFLDDVEEDAFLLYDGLTESVTFTFPRGLGPVTATMNWRFGNVRYEGATEAALQPSITVPTPGLTVDSAAIPVYFGSFELFIDSVFGDIGNTQISNALYGGQLTISRELDQKRWANGTGFDLAGYSSGNRSIELQLDFAKTDDTVGTGSETDAWFSETAINRFVRLEATSAAEAQAGIPYSWVVDMPMRYYTRAEDAEGGNSVIQLTGHQYYSSDLAYAISSTVVCTLTEAQLGVVGS